MAARSPGGGEIKDNNPQIKPHTLTEREVVSRIPKFLREREDRRFEKKGQGFTDNCRIR